MTYPSVVFSGIATGSASSVVVPTDASLAQDDLRYVFISISNNTITTPTDWTLVSNDVIASTRRIYIFSRVHDENDPSSYTFTFSAGSNYSMVQVALQGYATADPIDVGPTADSNATSGTTLTAPSVTTTVAEALFLTFFASINNQTSNTLSTPSGMTLVQAQTGNGTVGHSALLSREDRASAGSTGTRTSTSGQSAPWGAVSLAIAPQSATTGVLASSTPLPAGALPGTVSQTGELTGVAPPPTGSLTGTQTADGALAASAPLPSSALSGTVSQTGVLAGTMPLPSGALTGTQTASGALAGSAPPPAAAVDVSVIAPGELAAASPLPTSDLAGTQTASGVLDAAAALPSGALTGTQTVDVALNGVASLPVGALSAAVWDTGDLAGTTPVPSGTISSASTVDGALDAASPLPTGVLDGSVVVEGALAGTSPIPVGALDTATIVGAITAQGYATAQGATVTTQDGEPGPTMIATPETAAGVGAVSSTRLGVVRHPAPAGVHAATGNAVAATLSPRRRLRADNPTHRVPAAAQAPQTPAPTHAGVPQQVVPQRAGTPVTA